MKKNIVPVILVGGTGTRLWPLSRSNYPKQFNHFGEEHSSFQKTILRAKKLSTDRIYVVVGKQNYFLCVDQLAAIGVDNVKILVEPEGKNTAPAIAVAAEDMVQAGYSIDSLMLVLSADHAIGSDDDFAESIGKASLVAQKRLVLFGVKPTKAETGYGYIEPESNTLPSQIKSFVEKPNKEKARAYLAEGKYYWNSGIFMFSLQVLLEELTMHTPELAELSKKVVDTSELNDETLSLSEQFLEMPSVSIDYALMEKTSKGYVAPINTTWSDLGTWSSMYDVGKPTDNNNVEKGKVVSLDTKNSYLHSDDRLLACVGVENLVVVAAKDAVMVAKKDQSQKVKDLIAKLKITGFENAVESNFKVYRPWGSYETLIMHDDFQVKHIVVNPGGKLSLQLHHKRSEHWVVVSGVADVVCGDDVFQLHENQSTYIPLKTKHRLANLQEEPLHLIEVQVGSYLGEDDIVRFDDVYGRTQRDLIN